MKWSDVDWINGKLSVERGIACQQIDDVKTAESGKALSIGTENSDIRTTMNIYDEALSAEMAEAHGKVVRLTLSQSKRIAARIADSPTC